MGLDRQRHLNPTPSILGWQRTARKCLQYRSSSLTPSSSTGRCPRYHNRAPPPRMWGSPESCYNTGLTLHSAAIPMQSRRIPIHHPITTHPPPTTHAHHAAPPTHTPAWALTGSMMPACALGCLPQIRLGDCGVGTDVVDAVTPSRPPPPRQGTLCHRALQHRPRRRQRCHAPTPTKCGERSQSSLFISSCHQDNRASRSGRLKLPGWGAGRCRRRAGDGLESLE